jgi:hypothetical protein
MHVYGHISKKLGLVGINIFFFNIGKKLQQMTAYRNFEIEIPETTISGFADIEYNGNDVKFLVYIITNKLIII